MYEFDNGLEASVRRRREQGSAGDGWPFPGRHASQDEIRDETPIFHALTIGGWRARQATAGVGSSGAGVRRVHRGTTRPVAPRGVPAVRRPAEGDGGGRHRLNAA
ncbi:hypothetical protein [Pseudonocardia phyllosphaerae]|uniref:hypothetical protein n=1 Tax=Pseudonocardia phyllosphaerae TaxID=3390502 RepID=UPI00397CD827